MFTTREAVEDNTGVVVDQPTLATAQMMIEAYIGKSDGDVVNAADRSTLARAVTFQAVYINGQALDLLEQVAVEKQTVGATNTTFNVDMLAPFMSPWAMLACKKLSWKGTRSIKTGKTLGSGAHGTFADYWSRD